MRFGVALDLWSKEELRPADPLPPADGSGEGDPPFDTHPEDDPGRQDAPPTPAPAQDGQADYPKEAFDRSFPKWKEAIEAGARTAAQVIALASSKGRLNPVQKAKIEAVRRK